MGEATERALQEVAAARAGLTVQVDELASATRSAVDIPAKVRRNPLRSAGLAGGAAFLAVGGPKRVLRGALDRFGRRRKAPAPLSLLPDEVQRAVEDLGADAAGVRDQLERQFADFLDARRRERGEAPGGRQSFWRLFDVFSGVLGGAVARRLVERFLAADPNRQPSGRDDSGR
ncbi:MAG TPA: hypothetical protein VFW86_00895 [Candidatus Limnocylindrales bacterium]|jgi:hypothetical protein|nr:hypothetical protein [Candidatus Limnocylindrales bacterium]